MTAPTPRDQLAEALFAAKQEYDGDFYVVAWADNSARKEWYALADALLPLIERAKAEAAAEALDSLVEELTAWARMADNNADEWPEKDHRRSAAIGRGNGYRRSILRAKAHAMSHRAGESA